MQKKLSFLSLILIAGSLELANIQAADNAQAAGVPIEESRDSYANSRGHYTLPQKNNMSFNPTFVQMQQESKYKDFSSALHAGKLDAAHALLPLLLKTGLDVGVSLAVQGAHAWWTQPSLQEKTQIKRLEFLKKLQEKAKMLDESLQTAQQNLQQAPDAEGKEIFELLKNEQKKTASQHNKMVRTILTEQDKQYTKEFERLTKEENQESNSLWTQAREHKTPLAIGSTLIMVGSYLAYQNYRK